MVASHTTGATRAGGAVNPSASSLARSSPKHRQVTPRTAEIIRSARSTVKRRDRLPPPMVHLGERSEHLTATFPGLSVLGLMRRLRVKGRTFPSLPRRGRVCNRLALAKIGSRRIAAYAKVRSIIQLTAAPRAALKAALRQGGKTP
jgi:hypothetical protein